MAIVKMINLLPYVKQGQDMCLYAGIEILLKYNGIHDFNQNDLFALNKSRVVQQIAIALQNCSHFQSLNIDYPEPRECSLDKIKTYINQNCPVLVNLYDKHHTEQGIGHSNIIIGYDDEINAVYLVDPNQDENLREASLSYNDFQQKWNNGPVLELIAVKQSK